jgi:hypothetical protein
MDTSGPFVRYSMAGWVFLIVLLASVALSPNQTRWAALTTWVVQGTANQTLGSIAAAAFGIIAGVSAPPALGYVLTRAAAGIVEHLKDLWDRKAFGKVWTRLRDLLASGQVRRLGDPKVIGEIKTFLRGWQQGIYDRHRTEGHRHAIFYEHAKQPLIDWRDERVIEAYASFSCALAAFAALAVAQFVYSAAALGVTLVTVILATLLVIDGRWADQQRGHARAAWLDQQLLQDRQRQRDGREPVPPVPPTADP